MEDIQNPNPPQPAEPTPLTPPAQSTPPTAPPVMPTPPVEPAPTPVAPPNPTISKPLNTKSSLLIPGIVSLLVLGLIGGSVYFFFFRTHLSAEEQAALDEARKNNVFMVETSEETEDAVVMEEADGTEQAELPKRPQVPDSCKDFADKLEACEAFTCNFKHPMTGEMMKREIIGRSSEDCNYNEEMPNGGSMNCLLKESTRIAVAELYKTPAGKASESNPFEAAINNGECEIHGVSTLPETTLPE